MNKQRGIAIIDAIVGLGLMALAVLGMNAVAITVIRANYTAKLADDATRLAQQKIEQIVRDGYATATPGTTVESQLDAAGNPGGRFGRTTVIAAGALSGTRSISVTMAWTDYGPRHNVILTEITP